MLSRQDVRCVRTPFVFSSIMRLDGSVELDGRIRTYERSNKFTFVLLGPS
jgi:hypothetical protein